MRAWGIAVVLACAASALAADIRSAIAAMERGDFVAAERVLRAEVATEPSNAPVLSLLGVALDRQNKIREAEAYHRRALAAAPLSIDVLGNYGTHLMAAGDPEGARKAYLKITEIDPQNAAGNLALIRVALNRKDGADARSHLERLPEATLKDPQVSFSLALGFANAKDFPMAESLFGRALAANPADFNILYNLGAVAAAAGHYPRAREVLEAALRQHPTNVDVLYRLAKVDRNLQLDEAALELLARAAKSAPGRADVQKSLAATAADMGALDDALSAWDRYLKLVPGDDTAQRERAFTAARLGKGGEGIADLNQYLQRHPDDAQGYYQLGVVETQDDPAAAMAAFDKAIAIRPDFAAARSARGTLHYQQGKATSALSDLEMAAKARPADAVTLDHLGQTYLALDRTADAVKTLRRATELAPSDSTVQLHLGRALAQAGDTAESRIVMERFRKLGPTPKRGVPVGLVAYLALTPEERLADYRGRVEKAVREHPEDAAAQLDYLNLLLNEGKLNEAAEAARRLAALHPASTPELAIANARLLEARGKTEEAVAALAQAREAYHDSAELCWRETALLIRLKRIPDALHALQSAGDDDQVALLRAVLYQLAGQPENADRILKDLGTRRPEWAPVWVARASLLEIRGEHDQATRAIQVAATLGAQTKQVPDLQKLIEERRPADW